MGEGPQVGGEDSRSRRVRDEDPYREVKELHPLVMSWLVDADLNASAAHAKLQDYPFADGRMPSRSTIYGVYAATSKLTWRLVLGFADISSSDSKTEKDRIEKADAFLTQLDTSPAALPLPAPVPPSPASLTAPETENALLKQIIALQRAEARNNAVIYTTREALRAAEGAIVRLQSYVRAQSELFDQFAGVIDQEGRRPAAVDAIKTRLEQAAPLMVRAVRDRAEFEHIVTQTVHRLRHVCDQLLVLHVPPDGVREPMPGPVRQADDLLPDNTNDPLGEILRDLTKHEDAVRAGLHDPRAPATPVHDGGPAAAADSAQPAPPADTPYAKQSPAPASSSGTRSVPYATLITEPSALRKLRVATKQGHPLSDRETLKLVRFENGEQLLGVLNRLELAGDLTARDEVIRSGLDAKIVKTGPYAAMNRLLNRERYREAVLLHFDFERLVSSVSLSNRRSDPFKRVGAQGTPEQIVEVLDLLHDRDRPQDAHAVATAVARKRHHRMPHPMAVLWGLLGLPAVIALNKGRDHLQFPSTSPLDGLLGAASLILLLVFYTTVGLLLHRMTTRGKQDVVDVCLALQDNGHQDAAMAVLVAARDEKYLIYRRWVAAHRLRQAGLPQAATFVTRQQEHLDLTRQDRLDPNE